MIKLLIASSPVEIEAKAEAAALPQAAREAALSLFHELTGRIGEAARALDGADESWPAHRFYFADSGDAELASLLAGLHGRPDFLEAASARHASAPAGLFARLSRDGYTGVLVGHESHEGLLAPTAS